LDKSILSGFSFGVDKAQVLVKEGRLLGHWVSRAGSKPDGERVQAIMDFAPLREKLHIQQFLGCTNWLRWYLESGYAAAAKLLGKFAQPGAVFPAEGLGGSGSTEGDKAVRAIKLMCKHHIELAVLDEAAAIDGSRPLEQIGLFRDRLGWHVPADGAGPVALQGLDDGEQGSDASPASLGAADARRVRSARDQESPTEDSGVDAIPVLV
jgi:hypothetical protein